MNPIHPRVVPPIGGGAIDSASIKIDLDREPVTPPFRPVVIAPTHNNDQTLMAVLAELESTGIPIIVVDDGSTDSTARLLCDWVTATNHNRCVTHTTNRGKAAALQSGFKEALSAGFTHAVTIDTDAQLSPADIPKLVRKCAGNETAFILGTRDGSAPDYPTASRLGRRISNRLIRFETGQRILDSQCGLRVYPLKLVNQIRCRSSHFGFETEIITRCCWAKIPIIEMPVKCRYFKGKDRVSHFKLFVDSLRGAWMHLILIATALNPFHRRNRPLGAGPVHSLPRQFLHWLNPITAWRQVRHSEGARTRFSAGFAVGILIANLPVYGLQTLLGLYVARRFRLPAASVLAGVHVNVPPIGPLMIAGGIAVGHFILHGAWPHLSSYHTTGEPPLRILLPMLWEWVIGSVVLGIAMGAVTFVVLDFVLRLVVDSPAEASK